MTVDKKRLCVISAVLLFVLSLLSAIVPNGGSRIAAALVLLPASVLLFWLCPKRGIPSYNRRMVLLLMTVIAALFVLLHYLTGISYGFSYTEYPFSFKNVITIILPIVLIVVTTELMRGVVLAGECMPATILFYLASVVADVMIFSGIVGVLSFNKFMDLVAQTFLPAILANVMYNYMSRRYGALPNVVYRLIITLYPYIIPIIPLTPDSFVALIKLILPIGVYLFIDLLYEKKKKYARTRGRVLSGVLTAVVVILLVGLIMLVSCQFTFGLIVIGSESMSGEINKGDAVLYERYDDQTIEVGQVLVFNKGKTLVIHRVIDIKKINGEVRYFTKGDANDTPDGGYITDKDIVGLTNLKIPLVGYPTIWIRNIFETTGGDSNV